MKIINNIDDARKHLKEIQKVLIKKLSDSELLEKLLSKDEWDEQYYEAIKQEIKNRSNR